MANMGGTDLRKHESNNLSKANGDFLQIDSQPVKSGNERFNSANPRLASSGQMNVEITKKMSGNSSKNVVQIRKNLMEEEKKKPEDDEELP